MVQRVAWRTDLPGLDRLGLGGAAKRSGRPLSFGKRVDCWRDPSGGDEGVEVPGVDSHVFPSLVKAIRRSAMRRRMKRDDVPRRSGAWSTVSNGIGVPPGPTAGCCCVAVRGDRQDEPISRTPLGADNEIRTTPVSVGVSPYQGGHGRPGRYGFVRENDLEIVTFFRACRVSGCALQSRSHRGVKYFPETCHMERHRPASAVSSPSIRARGHDRRPRDW